ncbi:MAG: tetratricopeptide repeat protein [Cyanobacteriota bacterium]|nr:tetratricopeptide repeat protein [Cyanobacteriota bacterium]
MLSERYRPIETLSADRFGETYLSEDLNHPDRSRCILKRVKLPGKNPQSLKLILVLLRKKAEALKALNSSPHLPQFLNYFANKSSFYWVEEFIEGHPLSDEFVSGQPLSEAAVIQLLKDILEILTVIHDAGFIHGYLKPSSFIRRNSDNRLILIGLNPFKEICDRARRSQGRPVESQLNGSALYVSPEQDQGTAQFNSDLYALGMLAVVALTGSSATELSTQLSQQPAPADTRAWRNGIPLQPGFGKILDRMIHPDSQQRYQLAMEVLADLAKVGRKSPKKPIFDVSLPTTSAKKTAKSATLPPSRPVPLKAIIALAIAGLLGLTIWMRLPQKLRSAYLQRQALAAEAEERAEQALQYYNRALDLQPRNGQIYLQRSLIQQKLGKNPEALQDLTRAIELGPSSFEAYYRRGNLRLELGDDRGALSDYNETLRLDSNYAAAYVNRGSAHSRLGDEESAVSDYTKALEILTKQEKSSDRDSLETDKNLVAAYSNRCLSRLNLGDRPGAIEDCTQAINRQPTYTFAYQNRGLARRQSGDERGAIDDFNTAIELDAEDPEPYYNRGLVRQDLGDTTGAIEDFSAAIARNSQHILAYYDRGIARRVIGDRNGAIADWEKASSLCLEVGLLNCYQDAQYQLEQLRSNSR